MIAHRWQGRTGKQQRIGNYGLWTFRYMECLVRRWHSSLGPRVCWRGTSRIGDLRQEFRTGRYDRVCRLGLYLDRRKPLLLTSEHEPSGTHAMRRDCRSHQESQDWFIHPPPVDEVARGETVGKGSSPREVYLRQSDAGRPLPDRGAGGDHRPSQSWPVHLWGRSTVSRF